MARWTEDQYRLITGKNPPAANNLILNRHAQEKSKSPKQKVFMADAYAANWKGWDTIGGQTCYFQSLMERNYACVLEFYKKLGYIIDWEHEPYIFTFPRLAYKTAPFAYKPDYLITQKDSSVVWHEVKGWMNPSSKKKIQRFHKHFPQEGKIEVIDSKWFKANAGLLRSVPGVMTLKQMREFADLRKMSQSFR